jgi:ATP-binding cassette, subfamily B, bacterial HlyB/CyaB
MQDSTLKALEIVARRFGIDIRPEELRRDYALQEDEPSSERLLAIGNELGLELRSITLQWRELPRLRRTLPAILRLRDGSALVLEAIDKNREVGQLAILRDPTGPADAQAIVDEARLAELWAGEIILVKRRFTFSDEDRPFGVPWLAARVLGERKLFRDIIIAALVNTVFLLMPPLVARIVLDKVLANHSTSTLLAITIFFGAAVVSEIVLIHVRSLFLEGIAARLDGRLNLYIMEKLVRLPLDYFERNSTGRIINKLNAVWHIRNMLTGELSLVMLDLITGVVLIPILFLISWQLALLVLIWMAVLFVVVLGFIRPLQRRHRQYIATEHEKSAYLVETIYGMRTIKALALESRRRMGWDARVARAVAARYDLGRMSSYLRTIATPFERLVHTGSMLAGGALYIYYVNLLSNPQTPSAGLAPLGTVAVAQGQTIQPGLLVAFSILAGTAASPLMRIARLMLEWNEIRAAVSQVASVINVAPEDTRTGTGLRLPIRGDISFHDVRFRYTSNAPYALDGLGFAIQPGTVFGIMGRSGSGKTTITRLLQGLNADYDGIVKIDGMDLREVDLHYLRTNIGVVAQDNFLFTGTIRENIAMAQPQATLAEVVRAAQLAGAEEFIEKLPRGYNTLLEEGGVNLSGGQRQRIAIARALILDPPVLILDEATSALDAESEAIINANLMRMAEGRTIICVSHRLSMLVAAHAILVMEKGKAYDLGTHEELLHRCDIYRHMWFQQNRHVDPETRHAPIAIAHSAQA